MIQIFSVVGSLAKTFLENKAKESQAKQELKIRSIESTDSWEQLQAQGSQTSWKDEWLCLFFTIIFGLHFIPYFQNTMERGWEILSKSDPMFWYIILTIVGASFGVTTMNKIKKK